MIWAVYTYTGTSSSDASYLRYLILAINHGRRQLLYHRLCIVFGSQRANNFYCTGLVVATTKIVKVKVV